MVKRKRLRGQEQYFQIRLVATEERKAVILDKWIDRKCQLEKHWQEGNMMLC